MSNQNEKDGFGVCPKTGKRLNRKRKIYWPLIWLLPITGLLSLLWFLVRVIPKPSRAAYPCQRVAAPMASGFLVWLFGLAGSITFIHGTKSFIRKSRYAIAAMCFIAAVGTIFWSFSMTGRLASADEGIGWGILWTPSDPPNTPMGTAIGIHPGRVVWAYDPDATSWDGVTGYWRDYIDQGVVNQMMSDTVQALTGQDSDPNAWDALFKYFNQRQGKGDVGYVSGEKFAIKLNLNMCDSYNDPGNRTYTAPQLIYALLRQLVDNVGVAPADITVYDAARYVPDPIYNLCSSGPLSGVRFVDKSGGRTGRTQAQPQRSDPNAAVYHSNTPLPDRIPFGDRVPTRWMPQCVADANYIINLAGLKGHFLPGVSLCAKNNFGSTYVEPDPRFTGWFGLGGFAPGKIIHDYINAYDTTAPESMTNFANPARPMGSYNPLVDLMGSQYLGKKTVLFMIDGIYAARHVTADISLSPTGSPPWQSEPFNGDWSSMILASQDGVAIDSVALDFLRNEPTASWIADVSGDSTVDDYMHEAAQADNPPSGAFYDPDHDGNVVRLDSLGTHEHWNNAADKQYSRNLGTGDGIELVTLISEGSEEYEGDLDGDYDVDANDLSILIEYWLGRGLLRPELVVIEAEHYDSSNAGSGSAAGSSWVQLTGAGSTGDGYMQALPDAGLNINAPNVESDSPHLSYQINFSTTVPNVIYYLWVKGDAVDPLANCLHYGLDGVSISFDNDSSPQLDQGSVFSWASYTRGGSRPFITIPSAGIHTLDIWMREDGAKIDRLLLTTDVNYDPTGQAPEEGTHQLANILGDLNTDDQVNMTDIAILAPDWQKGTGP